MCFTNIQTFVQVAVDCIILVVLDSRLVRLRKDAVDLAVDVSSEEGDGKSWARKMLLGTPTEDKDVKDVSFDSFKSVSGVFCAGMKRLTPGSRSRNGLSTSPDGSQTMLSTVSLLRPGETDMIVVYLFIYLFIFMKTANTSFISSILVHSSPNNRLASST
jgi:hypothetical protein